MKTLILLNEKDNVAVACRDIQQGENIESEGELLEINMNIGFGHKVACQDIDKGEMIIKYGYPIGFATSNINKGDHVHLHNITCIRTEDLNKQN